MTTKRQRADTGRSVTTILFTDIVGSTETAASVGDAAWKSLLARYYAMVRNRLVRYGGREIDTAGDGLFASFPAPADAVRCAHSIRIGAGELGIAVRSGIHVGETETIEGKVGGIAVHIGARIAATAGPGEVLVSNTVRDLVEGSGLRFEDRGEATLKGVPGTRRLYLGGTGTIDQPDRRRHSRVLGSNGAHPVEVARARRGGGHRPRRGNELPGAPWPGSPRSDLGARHRRGPGRDRGRRGHDRERRIEPHCRSGGRGGGSAERHRVLGRRIRLGDQHDR